MPEPFLFVVGLLLLLGVLSSKLSTRIGLPVLVLFLGLGMLAGSDGPGSIDFDNYALANQLGTVALCIILFDGGMRTRLSSLKEGAKPALMLSTVGVVLTAAATGAIAVWLLDLSWVQGLLLGALVSSTDAAAVFSLLRTSGVTLSPRLSSAIEVESGSNDPMAIFLTVALLDIALRGSADIGQFVWFFITQFGVGTLAGLGAGWVFTQLINRANLTHGGLYPILALAAGFLSFGVAALLEGSGFLAVYLTGIVMGQQVNVFRRGILNVLDASAWMSQIGLFVMLGLLSFPSQLPPLIGPGLLMAFVLMVVARPVAVFLSLSPFSFTWKEIVLVSAAGLKGAVPITLATFPLLAGLAQSDVLFNMVFFVVLVSAAVQGSLLPWLADTLKLSQETPTEPPVRIEIHSLRNVDGEVVEYVVPIAARITGQYLRNLALPDGVVMTLVVRGSEVIMPRGSTRLMAGDHVFVAMRLGLEPLISRLFDAEAAIRPLPKSVTLSFSRTVSVGQLHRFFGVPGPTWSTETLNELLTRAEGGKVKLGPFTVEACRDGDPDYVTIVYEPSLDDPNQPPIGLQRSEEEES